VEAVVDQRAQQTASRDLQIESRLFASHYPGQPFVIRHRLSAHALFELERVLELGRALPPEEIEYNAGDLAVNQDAALTPRNGLSVDETIRRIRECKSWMVLKHVERDEDYRRLLHGCLDQVREANPQQVGDMRQREGFVFLSSPNSVTPYHMDPEHNFLLQIRGKKTIYIWDPADRDVLSEETIERFYGGDPHRNMPFQEAWQQRAQRFDLEPGDALYFPPTAPHWVRNGNEVSVSFSITFRSEAGDRRQRVYWVNHRLRKFGLRPSGFGLRPWADSAKNFAVQSAGRLRRLLKRG
jgi:ribosomal protein L16 Arg81 hydroxylase